MGDLTNKDNEQDSRLTYLESKFGSYKERFLGMEAKIQTLVAEDDLDRLYTHIDKLENKIKELDNELRGRIRKNEMWIAGAGAVIAAATTIIGIAVSVESQEMNNGSNENYKYSYHRSHII